VDRHGALCFVRPGAEDLVVREPEPADIALVERLGRQAETGDTLARELRLERGRLQEKLDSLVSAGLVLVKDTAESPLGGEDAERFSRQLPYLAELGDETALQQRLRDSTVAVIGCGGLGTWSVAALTCLGVGHLVLVDDDHVALSNLNRQILFSRRDVGSAKVAAAEGWVRSFDPCTRVTAVERRLAAAADVRPVIAGADAVVLAADWPPYELARWVNAACVETGTPFITAGQVPPLLKVGPTYIPGRGPCFRCHETALARASEAYEDYVAFRAPHPATGSTVGPASCVVGGLIALELLHMLTGHRPVTLDSAVLVNMRTLEVRHEPIARDPDCAACKHLE
jgi:bacteriocin biosynthesis cyclodehydratase domain-containing protein